MEFLKQLDRWYLQQWYSPASDRFWVYLTTVPLLALIVDGLVQLF